MSVSIGIFNGIESDIMFRKEGFKGIGRGVGLDKDTFIKDMGSDKGADMESGVACGTDVEEGASLA